MPHSYIHIHICRGIWTYIHTNKHLNSLTYIDIHTLISACNTAFWWGWLFITDHMQVADTHTYVHTATYSHEKKNKTHIHTYMRVYEMKMLVVVLFSVQYILCILPPHRCRGVFLWPPLRLIGLVIQLRIMNNKMRANWGTMRSNAVIKYKCVCLFVGSCLFCCYMWSWAAQKSTWILWE